MTTFEAKLDMYPTGEASMVSGEMNVPNSSAHSSDSMEFNTLDEPIKDTFLRDLRAVGHKFFHVLLPREKSSLLKEWDLWGPLLLCTFMAITASKQADDVADRGPEFAEVFVLVWLGASVVTINSKLLGGTISFFQSVCVLGYCMLPVAISLFICQVFLTFSRHMIFFGLRLIVAAAGFAWSTYAATQFLGDTHPEGKKGLAVYPICLFYFVLSWIVVSYTD